MAKTAATLVDPRLAKALSHPMRAHILTLLNERIASPNEISALIDAPLANVNYHVRALQDLGCVELVRTAQRRGATEHFYKALLRPLFSDRDWKSLPRSVRQGVSDVGMQLVWNDVSEAMTKGTFENRSDRHLSRTPLTLDDRGWDQLNRLLQDTCARAEAISTESEQRLADPAAGGVSTRLVMLHFEMPAHVEAGR